jgi:hypothetical protein
MSLSTKDIYVKHTLGRYLILLQLLAMLLGAEDFSFSSHVNTPDPYVKEPLLLSVDINQTNHDIVLLFNFDLKPSPDYTFRRIDSKETDTYHDAKVHYLYLIYPLKSGEVKIRFDLVKRITNDESIAYSFSGDRDNVKTLETKNSHVPVPPLTLKVKPLPAHTQLVGDFTLTHDLRQTELKAYEPLSFQITIKGKGYPPLLSHLIKPTDKFTLFTEKPIVKSSYSKEGTLSEVIYPMALSAKEDFMLPEIRIRAFDPQKERTYLLTVPQTAFKVSQPDHDTLVDSVDSPKPYTVDWGWLKLTVAYFIVFGAGFASGWLYRRKKRELNNTIHPLMRKIDACKDKKALLQLLLAHDATRFTGIIDKLEADLYGKGSYSLKLLKQEAKEQLHAN